MELLRVLSDGTVLLRAFLAILGLLARGVMGDGLRLGDVLLAKETKYFVLVVITLRLIYTLKLLIRVGVDCRDVRDLLLSEGDSHLGFAQRLKIFFIVIIVISIRLLIAKWLIRAFPNAAELINICLRHRSQRLLDGTWCYKVIQLYSGLNYTRVLLFHCRARERQILC